MSKGHIAARRHQLGAWLWRTLLRHAEPVEVIEQRFNFLPRAFRWRGDLRRVQAVVQVGEQPARAGRRPRRYFQVVCQDNSRLMLEQDLQLGAWYVRV